MSSDKMTELLGCRQEAQVLQTFCGSSAQARHKGFALNALLNCIKPTRTSPPLNVLSTALRELTRERNHLDHVDEDPARV